MKFQSYFLSGDFGKLCEAFKLTKESRLFS